MPDFKMPLGAEMLLGSLLKLMKIDPDLVVSQINDILVHVKRYTEQQAEMLVILKRMETRDNDGNFGNIEREHSCSPEKCGE